MSDKANIQDLKHALYSIDNNKRAYGLGNIGKGGDEKINSFNIFGIKIEDVTPAFSIEQDIDRIRLSSREAFITNPIMKRAVSIIINEVVGDSTPFLIPQIQKSDGSVDFEKCQLASKIWRNHSQRRKINKGGMSENLNMFLTTLVCSLISDGEVFILKEKSKLNNASMKKGLYYYKIIDPQRFSPKNRPSIPPIEYDEHSNPTKYNMYDEKDIHTIPSEKMCHLFFAELPEQRRGLPPALSVIDTLKSFKAFIDSYVKAAENASFALGALSGGLDYKTEEISQEIERYKNLNDEEKASYESDTLSKSDLEEAIENSKKQNKVSEEESFKFLTVPMGSEFTSTSQKFPDSGFKDFVETMLKIVSGGTSIDYPSLGNNYSGVTFSSGKMGRNSSEAHFKRIQHLISSTILTDMYFNCLDEAGIEDKESYMDVRFVGKRWLDLNMFAHIKAIGEQLQLGLMSFTEASSLLGKDPENLIVSLLNDKERLQDAGLDLEIFKKAKNMEENSTGYHKKDPEGGDSKKGDKK